MHSGIIPPLSNDLFPDEESDKNDSDSTDLMYTVKITCILLHSKNNFAEITLFVTLTYCYYDISLLISQIQCYFDYPMLHLT